MNYINRNAFPCTDIDAESAQYPSLCRRADGVMELSYQRFLGRSDRVAAGEIGKGKLVNTLLFPDDGLALTPVCATVGNAVWYAWTSYCDGSWRIRACKKENGAYGAAFTVTQGEALFMPALAACGDKMLVFWAEMHKNESCIRMCALRENAAGEASTVSGEGMAYRPAACVGRDGKLYLAYDVYCGSTYRIRLRALTEGVWTEETEVSNGHMWAASPKLASCGEGVLACWYEIGEKAAFAYLTADAHVENGRVSASSPVTVTACQDWYQNVAVATNSSDTAVFAYTWGKYNIHVRYRRKGAAWSEPVILSYNDGNCGIRPAILLDDDDTVHLVWQYGNRNGHFDRNASLVYNRLSLSEFAAHFEGKSEAEINAFVRPIAAEKRLDSVPEAEKAAWLKRNGYTGKLLFGDIHGQSTVSDGMGEVDQYYHKAEALTKLDFSALTDHDSYADWMSQSEWAFGRTLCRLMNRDGAISTILAYEWTPNEYRYDYGHKNVYYPGDDGEIFRSCDDGGITPYRLFDSIRPYGAIAIPHHPAANWQIVSAATDWSFHDPEVQRLAEIFSRHAPYEKFEDASIYTKNVEKLPNRCIQDALKRGYHLGITAGSDSHQMEHGVEGGIVAAYVPAHTREAVFGALYNRAVYGTTGARILLSFKVNGKPMGSELTGKAGDKLYLEVSVLGTDDGHVDVVRNNETVCTKQLHGRTCDFTLDETLQDGRENYFYIRVMQNDEHMAWSTPIWVMPEETEK